MFWFLTIPFALDERSIFFEFALLSAHLAAKVFGVSGCSAIKWMQLKRWGKTVPPDPERGHRRRLQGGHTYCRLESIESKTGLTFDEMGARLRKRGVRVF